MGFEISLWSQLQVDRFSEVVVRVFDDFYAHDVPVQCPSRDLANLTAKPRNRLGTETLVDHPEHGTGVGLARE